ncbi:hypothetical protein PISMIDRAFT_433313 [Pisolithus microcarpus 441]|uniref:Uncharacterized protein n=1 Tax=Pisolithus microcarpus 441 TaxID=765257 RepID=A0A0C9YXH7_9AGAM|nr:hypothetical protein PISMIDRAFT_433313 [Pisolithus microcarpus 441]
MCKTTGPYAQLRSGEQKDITCTRGPWCVHHGRTTTRLVGSDYHNNTKCRKGGVIGGHGFI